MCKIFLPQQVLPQQSNTTFQSDWEMYLWEIGDISIVSHQPGWGENNIGVDYNWRV